MLKRHLAFLVIFGLIGSAAFAAQRFDWTKEQVGKLRYGLSEREVEKIIPDKPKRLLEKFWAADGNYHQEWQYPDAGITLDMVSEKKGGPQSIGSMTITSPSTLKTQRGIGIGSTAAEVKEAYGRFRNDEDSKDFGGFIAGSIYGGVMFDFDQGRVSRIFVGAAAE